MRSMFKPHVERRDELTTKKHSFSVGIYPSQAAPPGYHPTREAITLGYAVMQECNKNGLRALVAEFHMWQLCPPFDFEHMTKKTSKFTPS